MRQLYNENITLINRKKNPSTGKYLEFATEFYGVYFAKKISYAQTGKGVESLNTAVAHIPANSSAAEKPYLPSHLWSALSPNEAAEYWTLQTGDRFYKLPDESFTLTAFDDSLRGSPAIKHYRLEGK